MWLRNTTVLGGLRRLLRWRERDQDGRFCCWECSDHYARGAKPSISISASATWLEPRGPQAPEDSAWRDAIRRPLAPIQSAAEFRLIIGAHLSLQHCLNGSEPANDPRVERDAIHGIQPNSVPRDRATTHVLVSLLRLHLVSRKFNRERCSF
jgi:hypothetical protein